MGIYATKSRWQRALQPVVNWCIRRRVHPDVFTYGALGLALLAGAAEWLAVANPLWLAIVPPCLLLRLGLNLMDGMVARALGLASPWGEVKNEFGDRIADALVFLSLAFAGYADARLAALALALILCVSYLGILGKAVGGPRVYGGIFGKGDRMISLALFTFYPLLTGDLASYNLYLVLAVVAAAITVGQRLRSIHVHTQPVR